MTNLWLKLSKIYCTDCPHVSVCEDKEQDCAAFAYLLEQAKKEEVRKNAS